MDTKKDSMGLKEVRTKIIKELETERAKEVGTEISIEMGTENSEETGRKVKGEDIVERISTGFCAAKLETGLVTAVLEFAMKKYRSIP